MGKGIEADNLEVRIAVVVEVNLLDTELRDRMSQRDPLVAVSEVVRSEVRSNLESLSYVRQVKTKCLKGTES